MLKKVCKVGGDKVVEGDEEDLELNSLYEVNAVLGVSEGVEGWM